MKARPLLYVIFVMILAVNAPAQLRHPMKVAMVSVLVDDPIKAFHYYTEVLGFQKVQFEPEKYIAVVRSPLDTNGVTILLEPGTLSGIEAVINFKKTLYEMGLPVITFSTSDIRETVKELKQKGVVFKKEPVKTDYGYEAVFDDNNGNYIQLIQIK